MQSILHTASSLFSGILQNTDLHPGISIFNLLVQSGASLHSSLPLFVSIEQNLALHPLSLIFAILVQSGPLYESALSLESPAS